MMATSLTNSTDCNMTTVLVFINPSHLYQAFGHWLLVFYFIIILFLMLLWIFSLLTLRSLYQRPCHAPLMPRLLYLTTVSAHVATITMVPLFFPFTLPFISLVQELLIVTAMLSFVNFTLDMVGGVPGLITWTDKNNTVCPLGTPPCCLLFPCPKPNLTPKIIHLIITSLRVLIIVIILKSFISICQVYSGVPPISGLHLANLPEFLSIPFFMSCMYSYKVFIRITGDMLPGSWQKLRGNIVFLLFIIFKTAGGLIDMLVDVSIFGCIPPTITPSVAAKLLTATIQFSIAIIIGCILSRMYARPFKASGKNTTDHLLRETNGKSEEEKVLESLLVTNNRNSIPFIDEPEIRYIITRPGVVSSIDVSIP